MSVLTTVEPKGTVFLVSRFEGERIMLDDVLYWSEI